MLVSLYSVFVQCVFVWLCVCVYVRKRELQNSLHPLFSSSEVFAPKQLKWLGPKRKHKTVVSAKLCVSVQVCVILSLLQVRNTLFQRPPSWDTLHTGGLVIITSSTAPQPETPTLLRAAWPDPDRNQACGRQNSAHV